MFSQTQWPLCSLSVFIAHSLFHRAFNRALPIYTLSVGCFILGASTEHGHNGTSHVRTSCINLSPEIHICLCLCWMTRREQTLNMSQACLFMWHVPLVSTATQHHVLWIRSSENILYPSRSVLIYCYCFRIQIICSSLVFTAVTLAYSCSLHTLLPSLGHWWSQLSLPGRVSPWILTWWVPSSLLVSAPLLPPQRGSPWPPCVK